MTRKKKARRIGSEGPAQYTEKNLTKQDINALARKKQNKHKGLKAGSRHSSAKKVQNNISLPAKDSRIGSKKPVPLIVEQGKKMLHENAEKELIELENDIQLNALLDRLEKGERLGAGLQAYVDEKLDRIEQLMKQLNLLND